MRIHKAEQGQGSRPPRVLSRGSRVCSWCPSGHSRNLPDRCKRKQKVPRARAGRQELPRVRGEANPRNRCTERRCRGPPAHPRPHPAPPAKPKSKPRKGPAVSEELDCTRGANTKLFKRENNSAPNQKFHPIEKTRRRASPRPPGQTDSTGKTNCRPVSLMDAGLNLVHRVTPGQPLRLAAGSGAAHSSPWQTPSSACRLRRDLVRVRVGVGLGLGLPKGWAGTPPGGWQAG